MADNCIAGVEAPILRPIEIASIYSRRTDTTRMDITNPIAPFLDQRRVLHQKAVDLER